MNYGYKTFIALSLATAGMWYSKSHAQNTPDSISQENTSDVQLPKATSNNDSTITLEQAFAERLTVDKDSLDAANFKKFQESLEPMLGLIAHTEGVKLKAYWDPHGKVWTIGAGNTIKPDGTKVRSIDRIRTKEELLEYFQAHVEKNMWDDMNKFLLIDKMNLQELAATGSICYNCGSGILKSSGRSSELAKAINQYVLTHSKESETKLKELWMKRVYSGVRKLDALVKRRTLEFMILTDAISMTGTNEYAVENAVDFSEIALGGIYNISKDKLNNPASVADTLRTAVGDSLEQKMAKLFPPQPNQTSTLKKEQNSR